MPTGAENRLETEPGEASSPKEVCWMHGLCGPVAAHGAGQQEMFLDQNSPFQ